MKSKQSILNNLIKEVSEAKSAIRTEGFKKSWGSPIYGEAMNKIDRALQIAEWELNPKPAKWRTYAGNIWIWNKDGMFLGNLNGQNHSSLRPSLMTCDKDE